ncbi:hypothetical protein F2Q69_00044255 [Brassica cretica]|uniref:Uncharacterized protein n=1 Tax=Brassica cretica TaxID=69181 RepID=A0A8S9NFE5_BRACR|nr:hypothetical protein F2Q69_00044255 [Brassica cretica]
MRCSLFGRYIVLDKATGIGFAVGSSNVSGSEDRGRYQGDTATGSERGDADESDRSPTPMGQVRERVCFDQIDCRPTIYHPVRHPNTIAYPEKFFESAQAIAAHSHLRWPDLSQEWIRRQQARIARVDWESRLPCVLGPRKSRLPLFTRKQQRLLDKAREMDGSILRDRLTPELTSLLKVVEPPEKGPPEKEPPERRALLQPIRGGGTAETSASGPKKKKKKTKRTKVGATDEIPPEESAPFDTTSKGSKSKKKKDGRKKSRGVAEVGISNVSGSEDRGRYQGDTATGSERGDADESDWSPTPVRQFVFRIRSPIPRSFSKVLKRSRRIVIFVGRILVGSGYVVSKLGSLELRLPCVPGPRKSHLPLFTRKQQRLLDKAREMDGVPDLSALLKGKLQLLTKKSTTVDPQGPSNSGVDVTSEGGGTSREGASREGASREEGPIATDQGGTAETSASGPKRKKKKTKKTKVGATDEIPPEESAPLDATSEGSKSKKKKDGRKRSRGGAEG